MCSYSPLSFSFLPLTCCNYHAWAPKYQEFLTVFLKLTMTITLVLLEYLVYLQYGFIFFAVDLLVPFIGNLQEAHLLVMLSSFVRGIWWSSPYLIFLHDNILDSVEAAEDTRFSRAMQAQHSYKLICGNFGQSLDSLHHKITQLQHARIIIDPIKVPKKYTSH
jgi:hypothetical protein